MKTFLMTITALAFTASMMFAQNYQPLTMANLRPNAQTPPPFAVQSIEAPCSPDRDSIEFADWAYEGAVNKVCFSEDAGFSSVATLWGLPSIQQTFQAPDGSFFAYSGSGKVYRYQNSFIYSWRVFGGGVAFDPDFSEWSLMFRFPWEGDVEKAYVFPGAGYYFAGPNDPSTLTPADQFHYRCYQVVKTKVGYEYCLDAQSSAVLQPAPILGGLAGFDYSKSALLLAGQHPFNMVAVGNDAYVLTGIDYQLPPIPASNNSGSTQPVTVTYGKLVALHPQGADSTVTVLVDGIDVPYDYYQSRLAAGSKGLYFVKNLHGSNGKINPAIMYYSFARKQATPIVIGDTNTFFSGLSVIPATLMANNTVAIPGSPSTSSPQ